MSSASKPASNLQELPVACVRCQRGGACSQSLGLGGSCGLATSPSCTAYDRTAVHRPLSVSFLGKAADRFEATSGASSPVSDGEFRLDLSFNRNAEDTEKDRNGKVLPLPIFLYEELCMTWYCN